MRKLACLALLVAGCASPEQKAAEETARAEAYRQHVLAQCRGYGFAEGTDRFRECMMQVDMAYRQQNEAQRQMLLQEYLRQRGMLR